jgi:hypothetical protein
MQLISCRDKKAIIVRIRLSEPGCQTQRSPKDPGFRTMYRLYGSEIRIVCGSWFNDCTQPWSDRQKPSWQTAHPINCLSICEPAGIPELSISPKLSFFSFCNSMNQFLVSTLHTPLAKYDRSSLVSFILTDRCTGFRRRRRRRYFLQPVSATPVLRTRNNLHGLSLLNSADDAPRCSNKSKRVFLKEDESAAEGCRKNVGCRQ